ncbi:MAG: hypothetical protein M1822_008860 [Bathelium mastoideum]|nr:MAG: hypothetical protein M1822_008860 [Bathelium mastoideum]
MNNFFPFDYTADSMSAARKPSYFRPESIDFFPLQEILLNNQISDAAVDEAWGFETSNVQAVNLILSGPTVLASVSFFGFDHYEEGSDPQEFPV